MRRLAGGVSVTSASSMKHCPSVIVSSPAIMRSSVDLPQPDGPTSTQKPPSGTAKEMPFTALKPPG